MVPQARAGAQCAFAGLRIFLVMVNGAETLSRACD